MKERKKDKRAENTDKKLAEYLTKMQAKNVHTQSAKQGYTSVRNK